MAILQNNRNGFKISFTVRNLMPLNGVPSSISPELLYALARMGHGDFLVIADSNFPSDSLAISTTLKVPIRASGLTTDILRDILVLFPLDSYIEFPVIMMDRVQSDKEKDIAVPAYNMVRNCCQHEVRLKERFDFYDTARSAFCIVTTTDNSPYANIIIYKGVL